MVFWRSIRARCVSAALLALAITVLAAAGDWPQWRGPNRNDLSDETNLLNEWPADGPRQVWLFRDCGVGYSGPAIVGDTLYILGARQDKEQLIALDAQTGQERWAVPLDEVLDNNWGDGPRSTPTVDGDRVYTLTGRGKLDCVNASDGTVVWSKQMEDLGGEVPNWGYTESVLVDGDLVICAPGGDRGTLAALNKYSGDEVWRSTELTEPAAYSSVIPVQHGGKRQYVYLATTTLAGIDAANGKLLWQTEFPGRVAVIPTPLYHDGHVYATAGYGAGCKLVKLGEDNSVTDVYENKVMKNHHGGAILVDGHVYGHSDGAGWVCQNWLTGEQVWNHRDFGKGAIGYADGMFYCLEEGTGTVVLIEATTEEWRERGRFTLEPQTTLRKPDGRIWTHPVVANGRLYLRDQDLLFCFDVTK